jgi:hypothetical protein
MLVALQLVTVAATPLNVTVLVPCVAPKVVPVIITDAPTNPDVGLRLVMIGVDAGGVGAGPEFSLFMLLPAQPSSIAATTKKGKV